MKKGKVELVIEIVAAILTAAAILLLVGYAVVSVTSKSRNCNNGWSKEIKDGKVVVTYMAAADTCKED